MKSEIRVVSPGFRVSIIFGICLTIVVVVLALVYRFETSLILLATAGAVAGVGVVVVVGRVYQLSHRRELQRLELEKERQQVRLVTYQANKAQFESRIIAIPSTQRVLMDEGAPVRIVEATAGNGYKLLGDTQAATPVDLLAALDNVQRCLIVGASDTGKTTLLRWLVARRLAVSKVIVIDPHGWPGKWPAGAVVIGTGRDYAKIDTALTGLVQLMGKRYTDIGRGEVAEMGHDKITILIDEWRAITGNVTGAGDAIKALLTESRKAAFSVFVASHSDRARPLGLMGEYDLKDGFAVVRLTVANGQRLATLDTGSGEVPANLPGPYVGQQAAPVSIDNLTFTEADLTPQPTVTEADILRLAEDGASLNEIARQVYGSSGGKQVELIKRVIERYS